jgi:predicted patatin/cPLA2 family phospholipase
MKLALVIQGGGSRGIYSAGVLDVLMKNEIWADAVYGTSAGALAGVNYVSRDIGRAPYIFLTLMKDRRFMNPLRLATKGSVFNFDLLFFEVPKEGVSFNTEEFFSSKMEFHACATNCLTGEAVYFSKLDSEFYNGLAASCSLPLTTKPAMVHDIPYLDGGVVDSVSVAKALADGADKVIVVLTRSKGYRKKKIPANQRRLAHAMYRHYPVLLSRYDVSPKTYNEEMDYIDKLVDEGKIFGIYPSVPPIVSHAEKNTKKLQALLDEATSDAQKALPSLKEYLSK